MLELLQTMHFMDDTIAFRTDMQERLMRKANANLATIASLSQNTHVVWQEGVCQIRDVDKIILKIKKWCEKNFKIFLYIKI